eukprot:g9321.t1
MHNIKKPKEKIKGHVNVTSRYTLGGNALKTTDLFEQSSYYKVERAYDNINSRLWALAKNRQWDELLEFIQLNKNVIEPDWVSPMSYTLNNALHFAAMDNCVNAIEPLIKICRYNPHKKNRINQTPISISENMNHDKMHQLLNWYKPINVWRRTYKDNLFNAKGRIVETHKLYKKKKRRNTKPNTDDFGEIKFTGKTVDQFKDEWCDLKKGLKYEKIKINMKKKKAAKIKKRERIFARKAVADGFLPSLKGMR